MYLDRGIYTCDELFRGVRKKQRPNQDEIDFFVENREKVIVERIGFVKLKLKYGYCVEFFDAVYVSSMISSLISFSSHDKPGYSFSFGDVFISLMLESRIVGTSVLNGGLYMLNFN